VVAVTCPLKDTHYAYFSPLSAHISFLTSGQALKPAARLPTLSSLNFARTHARLPSTDAVPDGSLSSQSQQSVFGAFMSSFTVDGESAASTYTSFEVRCGSFSFHRLPACEGGVFFENASLTHTHAHTHTHTPTHTHTNTHTHQHTPTHTRHIYTHSLSFSCDFCMLPIVLFSPLTPAAPARVAAGRGPDGNVHLRCAFDALYRSRQRLTCRNPFPRQFCALLARAAAVLRVCK
jgi:hypothetical protein